MDRVTHLQLRQIFGRRRRGQLADTGSLDVPNPVVSNIRPSDLWLLALLARCFGGIHFREERLPERVSQRFKLSGRRVQDDLQVS
jgi:hypothetical protein